MLEVEIVGELPVMLSPVEVERLADLAVASAGIADGHLAVQFVGAAEIATLNRDHRGKPGPTDVLSFPIDGAVGHGEGDVERELGDVVICPAQTSDLREAIVHGVLHLVGFDHETDDGEMLALQSQLLAREPR